MRIVLHESLFRHPDQAALDALLHEALQRRCYLDVTTPEDPTYVSWLGSLTGSKRSDWLNQIEWTIKDRGVHRIASISVEAIGSSNWASATPQLTVADALSFLGVHYRIFVENARYDRSFFFTMLDPQHRPLVQWLENADRLIFANGGGIGELRKLVERELAGNPGRIFKAWVLFDSDAVAPGAVSAEAQALIDVCTKLGVRYTCLQRRAIENYLPKGTLYDWVFGLKRGLQKAPRKTVDAYWAMNDSQRFHYHLKDGFPPAPTAAELALYASVPMAAKHQLANGISKTIAKQYDHPDKARLRGFIEKEGCHLELQPSLAALLERLRVPYV